MGRCGNMKKRIFIITILSIAMLTACNESGKTNDISKNGQDKKQAIRRRILTKRKKQKKKKKRRIMITQMKVTKIKNQNQKRK